MATLLGCYGITPDVVILVKDFGLPIRRLTFYLLGTKGEGSFKVSTKFLNEVGDVIFGGPEATMDVAFPGETKRFNMVATFDQLRFPGPGKYEFILLVDGQEHYRAKFEVDQGKPEDFE